MVVTSQYGMACSSCRLIKGPTAFSVKEQTFYLQWCQHFQQLQVFAGGGVEVQRMALQVHQLLQVSIIFQGRLCYFAQGFKLLFGSNIGLCAPFLHQKEKETYGNHPLQSFAFL